MATDIFTLTNRPDPALFFHRDEEGDPRLGEVVLSQPSDYAQAGIVVLGCPQHEGVERNGGRIGAAAAPDAIRTWLYRLVTRRGVSLFDLGNTQLKASLETTHDVQQQIVQQVIADGKRLISLGGGNDLSYPDAAGLAKVYPDPLAFNIDAHLDVRASHIRHSGTPYRQLLDENILAPLHFYELAYQPFAVAQSHLDYLANLGAHAQSLTELRANGLLTTVESILGASQQETIFWGLDMDSVHSSAAPGVSAPNSLGLTADEICSLMTLAGRDPRSRLLEITEVNPIFDIDHRTCRLAAVAIWHFITEAL